MSNRREGEERGVAGITAVVTPPRDCAVDKCSLLLPPSVVTGTALSSRVPTIGVCSGRIHGGSLLKLFSAVMQSTLSIPLPVFTHVVTFLHFFEMVSLFSVG